MQVFLTLDDQVGCTAADRQFYLGIRMHVYLRVCREGKILIAPETHPNVIFSGTFSSCPLAWPCRYPGQAKCALMDQQ